MQHASNKDSISLQTLTHQYMTLNLAMDSNNKRLNWTQGLKILI